jgi:hypothetical protein
VTDGAASRGASRRALASAAALALATLALSACGSAKSTLPPAPSAKGAVSLHDLAHHPEVYADAKVVAVGTVERARHHLYALSGGGGGGGGTRIVLEPTSKATPFLGKRVRVSGIFTVTFQVGYEILASKITRATTA